MSRNFASVAPQQSYRGNFFSLPIGWGSKIPNRMDPTVAVASIDWNVYWQAANQAQNVCVLCNLQAQSAQANIIDRIESVKIDNTGSQFPVYVNFPDTNDTVTCAPNSVVTTQVFTNLKTALVIIEGLQTGFIPQTRIFFINRVLPPLFDPELLTTYPQWIGSPTQQRTNLLTPGFGPPALGDQRGTLAGSPLSNVTAFPLFGGPQPKGIVFVTGLSAQIILNGAAAQIGAIKIFGTIYGAMYQFEAQSSGVTTNNNVFERGGMNLRLDATDSFFVQSLVPATGGFYTLNYEFAYNPNA